jgi:predicted RNA binding protein YcfA (HicA-like mRNA interferase family)
VSPLLSAQQAPGLKISCGRRVARASIQLTKFWLYLEAAPLIELGRAPSGKSMRRRNTMADVQKAYNQVVKGRSSLSFRDLQRLLITLGFRLDRISGSHHIYLHPDVSRPINIQPAGKDAKPYQIRQLRDMIREFGLKLED